MDEVRFQRLSARSPRRGARDSYERSHARRPIGHALKPATYIILGCAHRTHSPSMESTRLVRTAPRASGERTGRRGPDQTRSEASELGLDRSIRRKGESLPVEYSSTDTCITLSIKLERRTLPLSSSTPSHMTALRGVLLLLTCHDDTTVLDSDT